MDMDAVWVISDVAPDGTYVVTVQAGQDVALTLPPDRAVGYVLAVLAVCAAAEFDAAVVTQFTRLGLSVEDAALSVRDLRADRPPVDPAATAPLLFVPVVKSRSRRPVIHLLVDGEVVGEWEPDEVREHAMHVLDAVVVADLDAGFRRFLVGTVGLDDETARAAVGDLQRHRLPAAGARGDGGAVVRVPGDGAAGDVGAVGDGGGDGGVDGR